MNVVVVIQARMGSSRLPGKVLMPLGGKPAIQQVVERARQIPGVTEVVLATSTSPGDDRLAAFCESIGATVVRGSENDVLDRYYQAARQAGADVVIRVTGDCPLLDPQESGKVLRRLLVGDVDYVSNCHPATYPDGLDTEACTFAALERAWNEARSKAEREHVTLYLWRNPDRFRPANVAHATDLSGLRLTLDEPKDHRLLAAVFDELGKRGQSGSLAEVLAVLAAHPEFVAMNADIGRDEGLARSLAEERQAGGAPPPKAKKAGP